MTWPHSPRRQRFDPSGLLRCLKSVSVASDLLFSPSKTGSWTRSLAPCRLCERNDLRHIIDRTTSWNVHRARSFCSFQIEARPAQSIRHQLVSQFKHTSHNKQRRRRRYDFNYLHRRRSDSTSPSTLKQQLQIILMLQWDFYSRLRNFEWRQIVQNTNFSILWWKLPAWKSYNIFTCTCTHLFTSFMLLLLFMF